MESSSTPPQCLPDVTISVHTPHPVVYQQYNTEQWGSGGVKGVTQQLPETRGQTRIGQNGGQ